MEGKTINRCQICGLEFPEYFPECPDCGWVKSTEWVSDPTLLEKIIRFIKKLFGIEDYTYDKSHDFNDFDDSSTVNDSPDEPEEEISTLAIRIPRDLHQKIRDYSIRNKVTMKSLFTNHIEDLLSKESRVDKHKEYPEDN